MDGTDKVAEWKLLLLVQQTQRGGSILCFFRSGEEDKRIGCSQDKGGRIQSIAYSQPAKSGKEGVDCVSKFKDVNHGHCESFHKNSEKSQMVNWYYARFLLPRDSGFVLDQERVISKKSDHSKPGHAQVTPQVQKCTYYAVISHRHCSVNCDLLFYSFFCFGVTEPDLLDIMGNAEVLQVWKSAVYRQ